MNALELFNLTLSQGSQFDPVSFLPHFHLCHSLVVYSRNIPSITSEPPKSKPDFPWFVHVLHELRPFTGDSLIRPQVTTALNGGRLHGVGHSTLYSRKLTHP
jgi:hypothetical protein